VGGLRYTDSRGENVETQNTGPDDDAAPRLIRTATLTGRERYHLLTSLVVPRPIAWVSTCGADGHRNLAPFSYFMGVASKPLLIALSIGSRRGDEKDTLRNIREMGAFCVNIVSEEFLAAMNDTAGEWPPDVDEFEHAGLEAAQAETVPVPYVAGAPAVLECRLFQEVPLGDVPSTLVLGEVLAVRLASRLRIVPGTHSVDHAQLRPVGRLWGNHYALLGEIRTLARPASDGGG
jgi:flavin reductase (DIM6/NTAB) family NADH-FMN oxidoreductase RutF